MTSRTVIDIHVLQTVPPSNLNRDDTGSPKSAIYGGVRRSRVSSQAWKRAIRNDFGTTLDRDDLGVRTLRLVEMVAESIAANAPDLAEQALALATGVLNAAGLKTKASKKKDAPDETEALAFLSYVQIDALARYAVETERDGGKPEAKAAKLLADSDHSIDVALFGRMVASSTDLNVDAACQVAHAISVHGVENEFDYFTAVDDRKLGDESVGAGMIGVVEFNSSTLYRYASLDADMLLANLGDGKAVVRAVSAFLRSMATSMPSGKQNTFANRTLPDAVLISVRDDQPINFVGAFEDAVTSTGGRVESAARKLAEHATQVIDIYDAAPVSSWVIRTGQTGRHLDPLGTVGSLADSVSAAAELVGTRLAANQAAER
ncbi:MAG TPA: type I-E CRISPR-associated protein Cas7/Cse4/CasC [Candidatus Acidoferrum sp.]|jgi:CRISPR system Cascade subunit CasC|nr:type I-E CRISPR-associated protein Cas7/Cse4/CasC [Candidatus Acidoferrum sp.]